MLMLTSGMMLHMLMTFSVNDYQSSALLTILLALPMQAKHMHDMSAQATSLLHLPVTGFESDLSLTACEGWPGVSASVCAQTCTTALAIGSMW